MILPPLPDRDLWLEWRRGGVGASDVSGILGISPWASPWSVWAEKVGLLPADDGLAYDDEREFGLRAEPMLSRWFEDHTGLHVAMNQVRVEHDEFPWVRATLDGTVHESAAAPTPLGCMESKAVFEKPWLEIPSYYQGQGQWQLHASGFERVWFAVLHGRRFRVYELARDDDDIAYMAEQVEQFWVEHVLTREPPPIDGSKATAEALGRAYPNATPDTTKELDRIQGTLRDLAKAKADKADAEERERWHTSVIKAEMGDTFEGTVGGKRVLTLRSQTRTTTCRHCLASETSDPYRVLNFKPTTQPETP